MIDENDDENNLNQKEEVTYDCTQNISKQEELNRILSKKNADVSTVVTYQNKNFIN